MQEHTEQHHHSTEPSEEHAEGQEALSVEPPPPEIASTYCVVTATSLLQILGITMEQAQIAHHILSHLSFIKHLVQVPTRRLEVGLQNERCRDIQAYAQQKLIHYLFSGEASKTDDEAGAQARAEIEENRTVLVDMGKDLTEWEEGAKERTREVFDALKEKADAWGRTIDEVTAELQSALMGAVGHLPETFDARFKEEVTEFGVNIAVSQQRKESLGIDRELGVVEKICIQLLNVELPEPLLSASELMSLETIFITLDDKLLAALEDITGFNQAGIEQATQDEKFIKNLTDQFEQHAVKVSRMLFEYYGEYATDRTYKVDSESALEFGVDPAVAEDYRALHIK